ncbi:MAG: hypothetical protein FD177_2529 [Desulfovibrionaceae bacterium]|nr:MAG: hypothetical protein FD177_2529 [Desulfovibrionaceae bacterium]
MSKIIALRPSRDTLNPVLLIHASHRVDCILLCLRSLERFTNLARFKAIYVVADGVGEDYAAILYRFMHTRDNVEVVHCSPRGTLPRAGDILGAILTNHIDDVVISLEEDVFVTPLWLEQLLEGYRLHRASADIPLVSALSPVSPAGRFALNRHLKGAHPAERSMFEGSAVEENWVYHRWMWEKVVNENFVENWINTGPAPYFYPSFASMDCAVYDRRLIEAMLPLPADKAQDGPGADWVNVTSLLMARKWKNAVVSRSIAHHYSFSICEEYLRSQVPLDMVWQYLQELWRVEQLKSRTVMSGRLRSVVAAVGAGR